MNHLKVIQFVDFMLHLTIFREIQVHLLPSILSPILYRDDKKEHCSLYKKGDHFQITIGIGLKFIFYENNLSPCIGIGI